MPLKPVSPQSIDLSQYEFADEPSQQDSQGAIASGLKSAGQFGAGLLNAATKAVTGPADLVNSLSSNKFAQKTREPGYKGVSTRIKEAVESIAGKGSTEATNPLSKAAQYTASSIPFLAATGPLSVSKVLADLAGSGAMVAAEGVTDNPFIKIGANILGQRGYSNIAKRIHKASSPGVLKDITAGNETHVEMGKKNLYAQERELGKKIKVDTRPIVSDLESYKDGAKDVGSFTISEVKEAQRDIDKLLRKLNTPNKTAADVYDIKRTANEFFDRTNLTEAQDKYYKGLNTVIKNNLEKIGSGSPAWSDSWKTADQLHSLQSWQTNLDRKISDWIPSGKFQQAVKHPLVQGAVATLGAIAHGKTAGLIYALPAVAQLSSKGILKPAAFLNFMYKDPEGQKILWKIMADAGKDSGGALLKSLSDMDKLAVKFQRDNPESSNRGLRPVSINDIDLSQYEFAD